MVAQARDEVAMTNAMPEAKQRLGAEHYARLEEFCRMFDVPTSDIEEVAASGHYDGDELLMAVETVAVIREATSNRKLDEDTIAEMKEFVVDAIRNGTLRFKRGEFEYFVADYSPESGEYSYRKSGFDLRTPIERGRVLQNAQHVVQHGRQSENTRCGFVRERRAVFADYMLHEHGAMFENRRRVDLDRFTHVVGKNFPEDWLESDVHAMRTRFANVILKIVDDRDIDRIGPDHMRSRARSFAEDIRPRDDFEDAYIRDYADRKPERTEDEFRAELKERTKLR